jgi:CRP/FNR family transcriptional regulator
LRLSSGANRLAELTGGRIEPRFARLFVKLANEMGRPERGGIFIPLPLSRQELADMTGTTIETCIRIMSRWGKENIVRTEKDGFVVVGRQELTQLAAD